MNFHKYNIHSMNYCIWWNNTYNVCDISWFHTTILTIIWEGSYNTSDKFWCFKINFKARIFLKDWHLPWDVKVVLLNGFWVVVDPSANIKMFMNSNNISIACKITTHMKYILICVIKCTAVLSFILFKLRETHPFEANYKWYLKEDEREMILETTKYHRKT